MDFAALYKSKLTTPEEAVKVVKSGDWVDYGWCTGTPNALDKALAARMDELENVNFRGGVLMRRPAIFDVPDVADKLTWNSWHMSGIERKACMEGFGFYSALRYSELPRWYRENVGRINVTMIQVAPMDAQGWLASVRRRPTSRQSARLPMLLSSRSTSICRAASACMRKRSMFPRSI